MPYEVRITRDVTLANESASITDAEWEAVIAADPELHRQSGLSAENPQTGEVISMSGDFLIWSGHSEFDQVPFRLFRGTVLCSVGEQFEEVLVKLKSLADLVGAQVVGDEGETY